VHDTIRVPVRYGLAWRKEMTPLSQGPKRRQTTEAFAGSAHRHLPDAHYDESLLAGRFIRGGPHYGLLLNRSGCCAKSRSPVSLQV